MGKGFVLGRRTAVAGQGEVDEPEFEQERAPESGLRRRTPPTGGQSPAQIQVPFRPTPEEQRLQEEDVRRQRMQEPRPTAQMQLPPLPQPQAAAPAAAPNPQARQQYAAMFPNEGVSQMIKGGIGSLG